MGSFYREVREVNLVNNFMRVIARDTNKWWGTTCDGQQSEPIASITHSRTHGPFTSLSRRGLGTRSEGLWGHRKFKCFDWLFKNKEILNGSENVDGENLELPRKFTSVNTNLFRGGLEEETGWRLWPKPAWNINSCFKQPVKDLEIL